jgi:hypothetical protein
MMSALFLARISQFPGQSDLSELIELYDFFSLEGLADMGTLLIKLLVKHERSRALNDCFEL